MSLYDQTDNFKFNLINFGTIGFQDLDYQNWRKLDGLLRAISEVNLPFAVDTGVVNQFQLSFVPVITTYQSGLTISFVSLNANTGPATVNVNGLGAKNIFYRGAALVGGEIPANAFVKLVYDSVRFHLVEPKVPA